MEEIRKPDPKGKEESARHRNRKLSAEGPQQE